MGVHIAAKEYLSWLPTTLCFSPVLLSNCSARHPDHGKPGEQICLCPHPPELHTVGTRSFLGTQEWHKTVSPFKNWNAPKIERAERLCSYNLSKHLPPLCGKCSLFRILPLILGKDKSGCTFCSECVSSQEEIFSSLEFWMYEKWFFLNKEFTIKHQQGSWKRWNQFSIPIPFPSHVSSFSGFSKVFLWNWVSLILPSADLGWQLFWPQTVRSRLPVAQVISTKRELQNKPRSPLLVSRPRWCL